MQKSDTRWLCGVLVAVLLFSIFGLPYFSQLGHPLWSILVYLFFAVIFLYGRNNRLPRNTKRQYKIDL